MINEEQGIAYFSQCLSRKFILNVRRWSGKSIRAQSLQIDKFGTVDVGSSSRTRSRMLSRLKAVLDDNQYIDLVRQLSSASAAYRFTAFATETMVRPSDIVVEGPNISAHVSSLAAASMKSELKCRAHKSSSELMRPSCYLGNTYHYNKRL